VRELERLAAETLEAARAEGRMLATAESCTGGLVAAWLTAIPGSSDVVDRGFVTYSNGAKRELLGVPEAVLGLHGAVSEETAVAMAEGALARSDAGRAVSITGIAGPGGGSAEKPEGRVCFGLAETGEETWAGTVDFWALGRTEVRLASVKRALELLRDGAPRGR
jgi:nicotinamide-nucleotide amidase